MDFNKTDFIKKLIMGLIIGIACVTPGLSGGVIAVAAGLYEPSVNAILGLRRGFKKNFMFLLPLGIGACAGILLFSHIMEYLMTVARHGVTFVFLGFVIGSMPSLIKEANQGGGFKGKYIISFALALTIVLVTGQTLMEVAAHKGDGLNASEAILGGIVIAAGTIIPGISSSFLLIALNVYDDILSALTHWNIGTLALVGIGFLIGALALIKIIEIMFRRFRGFAYYAVIGFLAGTMLMVFPGLREGWDLVLDTALFIGSIALSYIIMNKTKSNAED